MLNRSDSTPDQGTLIGRRSVLLMLAAVGVLAPLLGAAPARADESEPQVVPEESGAVPWT